MGRIVAIDYGHKRVGLACTDELQIIASGLATVDAKDVLSFLKTYIEQENVELLVVGEPKQMDNTPSESAKQTDLFVETLKKTFQGMPIVRMDERFTSKMAFQTMIDSGLKKKQRQNKALVDTISATIILQSYLSQKEFGLK